MSRVLSLILRKPEYADVLRRLLEVYDQNPAARSYIVIDGKGFLYYDVKDVVGPGVLGYLVQQGILKAVGSRKTKVFYFADPQGVRAVLDRLSHIEEEEAATPGKPLELPLDLFDVIVGYGDVKDLFMRSVRADRPVHILMVGPPSTAKSLFLYELERLPGSYFVTAGTSTRAGLRDVIYDFLPRMLLIDELDKVRDARDLSVLLTWMESGRVVITKHRLLTGRRGKGWVFAACNTTNRLPPELLSRFLVLHFKPYSREELDEVIVRVLTSREGATSDLARYIASKVAEFSSDVRDAVKIARLCKTKEEVDDLVKIIIKYKP